MDCSFACRRQNHRRPYAYPRMKKIQKRMRKTDGVDFGVFGHAYVALGLDDDAEETMSPCPAKGAAY